MTDTARREAERIAEWAGRVAAEDPPKRAQGAAGHLSAEEKTAIRIAYLESGGTVTYKALAVRFNVNRDTVSGCMKGPEFTALQKQLESEIRQTAVARLKALTMPAVDAWGDAIPIAAQKGDHRPARELLEHVGIVETTKDNGGGLLVLTQVQVNGAEMTKGSDGRYYTRDRETGKVLDENGREPQGTVVQIGGGPDVNIGLAQERVYRDVATGKLMTEGDLAELPPTQTVVTMSGLDLSGLPNFARKAAL